MFADALAASKRNGGKPCPVCVCVHSWSGKDLQTLVDALADESVLASQLTRALKESGVTLGIQAVGRHRRGECNGPGRNS